ncbi:MAG TPA: DNA-binding protein [Ktedonobacteraceae bacterium]
MEMRPSHQLESDLPLELSQPARRALVGAGYVRLEQLAGLRASEVKQLHGVGPKTLTQLRRALEMLGLSFADEKSQ